MVKKNFFLAYELAVRWVSRSGIARCLLPLRLRRAFGRFLKRGVLKVASVDRHRFYDVLGHRMYLHPRSAQFEEMAYGVYERDTVEVFYAILKPGMTVVDVGAFIGYYTLLSARLVGPHGRVYCFEPNPEAFEFLKRNIEENGYHTIVRAIPKAVSNRKGSLQLYIPYEDPGEASLHARGGEGVKSHKVETISLDEFFAEEGWPKVNLIKIDVEGAEVEVLEGIREIVQRNPDLKLIVEFNPSVQIEAVGDYKTLFNVLIKLGFNRIYAIRHGLKPVSVPQDIPKLVKMTETTNFVNLLCEKGESA